MPRATITVDADRPGTPWDPMIFGQYLEHVQPEHRCIYGAIVDESSSLTDERGFRTDVTDAVRNLHVPVVRWPGGCFADVYHWEDGIGPAEGRPVLRNWHWGGIEPNTFGTDEFLAWCEATATQPYINLNLGTGTLDEAIRWIDYCNGHEPTRDVQRRRENGRQAPYDVRYWGIGNEQWGDWEAGHMTAPEYAAKLRNWATFLRKLDPAARFLGVGSAAASDPDWDLAVLREAGHLIDFLTLHIYGYSHRDRADDYYPTVTFPVFVEERLRRMGAVIDAAMSEIGREEPVRISVDEWNIRHLADDPETGVPTFQRLSPRTLRDAVAAAGVFHAMLRNARHAGMANYVFLLNGNGVLLVEPDGIVRTPLYHLFAMYQRLLLPTVLDTRVASDELLTSVRLDRPDRSALRSVPLVDAITTGDPAGGRLAVAVVNRHQTDATEVTIEPRGVTTGDRATIHQLHHADAQAINDRHQPEEVVPAERTITWDGTLTVPAHSVTIVALDNGR